MGTEKYKLNIQILTQFNNKNIKYQRHITGSKKNGRISKLASLGANIILHSNALPRIASITVDKFSLRYEILRRSLYSRDFTFFRN